MANNKTSRKSNMSNNTKVRAIVRGIIDSQMENKVIISVVSAAATPAGGTVLPLSVGVIQGDALNQRSGDTITPITHHLKTNAQAITNSQSTRFIVVRDNQNNGATPAVTDVLDNADYLSPYNSRTVYQQKRFKILYDRVEDVNIAGQAIVTRAIKLGKIGKIFYNGATAVATANGHGAMFMLIIASNTSGTYDFSWEMTYHDA